MSRAKQVIVVRRDLRMKRSELSSLIAKAASKFFLDADESAAHDRIMINLSSTEASWIADGNPSVIVLGVPSVNALERVMFNAETEGLSVYRVKGTRKSDPDDVKAGLEEQVLVAAIGPDASDSIDRVTGKLKLL